MAKSDNIPYQSKSSLKQKLGFKVGMNIATWNLPENYNQITENILNECIKFDLRNEIEEESLDLVHIFGTDIEEIGEYFFKSIFLMKPKGGIWCSWLKGTSKLKKELNSEINDHKLMEMAFPAGWSVAKVCSIDENWSAIKFVKKKENQG